MISKKSFQYLLTKAPADMNSDPVVHLPNVLDLRTMVKTTITFNKKNSQNIKIAIL